MSTKFNSFLIAKGAPCFTEAGKNLHNVLMKILKKLSNGSYKLICNLIFKSLVQKQADCCLGQETLHK
jgi:hypothetical protein